MKNKRGSAIFSNLFILILFVVATFVGGILAGILYYDMALIESTLQDINFQIPIENNATTQMYNITDFQDILSVTVYPVLGLRSSLPTLTYFMIFAFIIAMAVTAYVSSKNQVFLVIHFLFVIGVSYFCFILSNTYQTLLENPFINDMMLPFDIYNKIMLYLPAVTFFSGLVFGLITFVNPMKPQSNFLGNQQSLNYGGDY